MWRTDLNIEAFEMLWGGVAKLVERPLICSRPRPVRPSEAALA